MNIKSPCISVCRVKQGICIGCFRTAKQVTEWYDASDERKLEILKEAEERKNQFEIQ